MSLDILYFLAVNRRHKMTSTCPKCIPFEMWSRFLAESRLAMRRPTPVIFAAQKQAQSLARPSGCHRASESVASCQAPRPGSDSADWTAWEIESDHFLVARPASFVPGGLCVSRRSIFRCVAALSPSSPLGKFETTKQELSALSVKESKAGCRGASGWACNLGTLRPAHEGQPLETTPDGRDGLELVPHFRA